MFKSFNRFNIPRIHFLKHLKRNYSTYDYLKNIIAVKNVGHPKTSLDKAFDKIWNKNCYAYNLEGFLKEEISFINEKLFSSNKSIFELTKLLNFGWNIESPIRGPLILLISKAASTKNLDLKNFNSPLNEEAGVIPSQLTLAKVVEMMHVAANIHMSINRNKFSTQSIQVKKLSLLVGDFIWAKSLKYLADLHSVEVFSVMTSVNTNLSQGMFMSESEGESMSKKKLNLDYWLEKNFLLSACLTASGCKATLILARLTEEVQNQAFDFGRNFGFCLKGYQEIQWFEGHSSTRTKPLDLFSLPVIMHESNNFELVEAMLNKSNKLSTDKFQAIIKSGNALEKSREVVESFRKVALVKLNCFEDSEARQYLTNLICSIKL